MLTKAFSYADNRIDMKKVLPVSYGFSLIELLVVVAIMAILGTVGIVFFGNAQSSARDAKRKSDVKDIASAMEQKRFTEISESATSFYRPLEDTDFKGGRPGDPSGDRSYCIKGYKAADAITAPKNNPPSDNWRPTSSACPEGWATLGQMGTMFGSSADTRFRFQVCALLEASSETSIYCEQNRQ